MNPRLVLELAWRRQRWLLPFGLAAVVASSALALNGLARPAPAIVAASDDGSRRAEAHYQAFRALLIAHDALEARQNAIIDLALRHGLAPGRIDFGRERNETGGFDRATLSFPLRGDYAGFQKFLAAALAGEPGLGVAELTLQREATGNGIVAQLRLVFHLQPAPGGRS